MNNVILIGMPASGKSTAGVLLAKTIGYGFIDGDLLIQSEQKALLCDLIARHGAEKFIEIEENVNASLRAERCVIATGGSAVYGERGMRRLKEIGKTIYLKLGLPEIERRLENIVGRGVVMRKSGETLAELYAERALLYEKYADFTVDCDGKTLEETVRLLAETVERF